MEIQLHSSIKYFLDFIQRKLILKNCNYFSYFCNRDFVVLLFLNKNCAKIKSHKYNSNTFVLNYRFN